MICNTRFHHRGHSQTLMNSRENVINEMQGDSVVRGNSLARAEKL